MWNKVCPNCQKINSGNNLKCIKCSEPIFNVMPEENFSEEIKYKSFKNYSILEYFTNNYSLIKSSISIILILAGFLITSPILIILGALIISTFFLSRYFDIFFKK